MLSGSCGASPCSPEPHAGAHACWGEHLGEMLWLKGALWSLSMKKNLEKRLEEEKSVKMTDFYQVRVRSHPASPACSKSPGRFCTPCASQQHRSPIRCVPSLSAPSVLAPLTGLICLVALSACRSVKHRSSLQKGRTCGSFIAW